MKNPIILANLTGMPDWLIVAFILFSIIWIFFLIYGFKKILNAPLRPSELEIIKPKETIQLQKLIIGTTLIVLDTEKKLPIVQRIEDYQRGISANIFKNTFYLDNFGKDKPKKLRTYVIESIGSEKNRVLRQVALFITPDGVLMVLDKG